MPKAIIKSAGWIVIDRDHNAIWGFGKTSDDAWAHFVSENEHCDTSGYFTTPASQAILDRVSVRGGAISWGTVNGVSCTDEEEEASDEE